MWRRAQSKAEWVNDRVGKDSQKNMDKKQGKIKTQNKMI